MKLIVLCTLFSFLWIHASYAKVLRELSKEFKNLAVKNSLDYSISPEDLNAVEHDKILVSYAFQSSSDLFNLGEGERKIEEMFNWWNQKYIGLSGDSKGIRMSSNKFMFMKFAVIVKRPTSFFDAQFTFDLKTIKDLSGFDEVRLLQKKSENNASFYTRKKTNFLNLEADIDVEIFDRDVLFQDDNLFFFDRNFDSEFVGDKFFRQVGYRTPYGITATDMICKYNSYTDDATLLICYTLVSVKNSMLYRKMHDLIERTYLSMVLETITRMQKL